MSKHAFLVSLLLAEASAAELCISIYADNTCSGEPSSRNCQTETTDGTCQTITVDGITTHQTATCTGTAVTITVYPDTAAKCDGTGVPVTYNQADGCLDLMAIGTKYEVNCDAGGDPCFADTTTACRILDSATAPSVAFKQCFGDEAPTLAERVPMKALAAGDVVLASPTEATRVIVNQHAGGEVAYSNMVTLQHEGGALTLTPDHIVYADGAFKPAGQVGVGATLEPPSTVTSISKAPHGIINPLTTSGTILAAGATGAPVVASSLSEWVADLLHESSVYPLPYSLTGAASYLFPESVQAFYDAHLEHFFAKTSTDLKGIKAAVPAPVALAILAAFDVACVGAFAAWASCSLKGAATLLAVAAVAKSRRVAKA